MKLSEELTNRGFVYQFSGDNLSEVLDGEPRTVYLGIDPTADAIHVGNLVPFMMLNHIMKAGHKVVLLLGGGTALIGDPSGRDTERAFAGTEIIAAQAEKMKAGIQKLSTSEIIFVNNYDWLFKLSAIEFMRDVGKYFTVNAMIKKDSVATRMESEQGISYTEFSYSLLQSYDFFYLFKDMGVTLQIGGSDQWGNLISGVDYIRRVTGKIVYALTMPLVVDKATGKKFGKSMGNAVWLDADKTSPYELYQFWLNTSDESVIDYLKLFTFLSLEEIYGIEKKHLENPSKRSAQRRLSQEVVEFVHGQGLSIIETIELVNELLFGDKPLSDLSSQEIKELRQVAPRTRVLSGSSLVDVLITSCLAVSKREAREFIEAGAIAINENIITDIDYIVEGSDWSEVAILRRGKKNRMFIEIT